MKTIIAGSRSIGRLGQRTWDYEQVVRLVEEAVQASRFDVTEVVSGGAGGPDRAGEQWAQTRSLPVSVFKPNWRLGRGAGIVRNGEMAASADALVALYDGQSNGTLDMINRMKKAGLKVYVHRVDHTEAAVDEV